MNRMTCIYAGLLAVLSCTNLTGISGTALAADMPAYDIQFGDVNNDNSIDVTDAQTVLQAYTDALAGVADTMEDWQKGAADVDKNGKVDVSDAQYILNYYVANTVAGKPTAWEEIIRPAASAEPESGQSDCENAYAVLKQMLEAMKDKDFRTVLDVTNIRTLMIAFSGEAKTDEEILQDTKMTGELLSYEIGEGLEDAQMLSNYNKAAAELSEEVRKELEEERAKEEPDQKQIKTYETVLPELTPVDKIYQFSVTVQQKPDPKETDDGQLSEQPVEVSSSDLFVYLRGGKWTVDTGFITLIAYQPRQRKLSACKTAARSVRIAVLTALADLQTENHIGSSQFNGEYFMKGSDFQEYDKLPENPTDEMRLWYCLYRAYPEITELEDVAFCLENGDVIAAAVSRSYDGELWYGTYPGAPDSEDETKYENIRAALAAAKARYLEQKQ